MSQKPMRTLLFLLAGISLLFAEPSVYRYGDTSSTKKTVISNKKTIIQLRKRVARQSERIEGLSSLIEGLSASIASLKREAKSGSNENEVRHNSEQIKALKVRIKNLENRSLEKKEPSVKKNEEPIQKIKEVDLSKKSSSSLFKEGVRLFSKGRYDEAKKRFNLTDTKGHKSAASNYYLGEISYYTKKYDDAIFYFKKSAGLYDRAGYIDTLLLHTAISLEKSGQKKQAKSFYENIITNYKNKKSAKIAKEKLKKF